MRKIPTVFKRDPEDMRRLLREVNDGCEWVLAGEGVATRKYDGTCCMFDGTDWWARREVKPGKHAPANFVSVDHDPVTGKTVGWEPMAQSPFAKFHAEALGDFPDQAWAPGTYELCGPKVNGNPEQFIGHKLVEHADAEGLFVVGLDYDDLATTVGALHRAWGVEGIVWHHPDGRMAKLKARDFAAEVTS
ncbi:MAG: mucin [Conexibacter sp.]|nr:mucin [Conexibacter sp.]